MIFLQGAKHYVVRNLIPGNACEQAHTPVTCRPSWWDSADKEESARVVFPVRRCEGEVEAFITGKGYLNNLAAKVWKLL